MDKLEGCQEECQEDSLEEKPVRVASALTLGGWGWSKLNPNF